MSTHKKLAADVVEFIERYTCSFILNDMRHARITRDTFDIYNMPKSASQAGIGPQYKRALIVNERTSDFHFLETVFVNRGHIV